MNGRFLVFTGFLINICLGAIYSFSIFRAPLEKLWGISATQSGLPFMVFLLMFSIFMAASGGLIKKLGPRKTSLIGSIMVGTGWIGASFSPNIETMTALYGIIGGAGVGVVYGCPIAVSATWFPRRSGLAIGLTVMGFGLSGVIIAPILTNLIRIFGPLQTFLYAGLAFLLVLTILSLVLRFPPSETSQGLKVTTGVRQDYDTDLNRVQMVKSLSFYALWSAYMIGCLAGLMAIGISSPFGREIAKIDEYVANLTITVFSVFNGFGRPLFGWITDKLNPRKSAMLSFTLILASSTALYLFGEGNTPVYLLSFSLLWLNLGGWLAMAPTMTKTLFGTKYYSENYGVVFTAYGVGAIAGTYLSGMLKDITGTYLSVFPIVILLATLGILIVFLGLKPVRHRSA
ncbi:MAG: OFA family MFS transporter [Crenarchaeota archaeon]|nr:OFA family MFS transporter [Thermoproteota archaeon]MDW8033600.1 OFA family MFS transporter [Nitrososphaerota archaeon]